jgi:transposase
MRKIREALRLRADGFSGRRVAQSLSLGRATISEYFRRADVEGLSWPLSADLSDANLESRLFPYSPGEVRRGVPQPDWAYVHAELRCKGVTLALLWEEYRGVHPDGYGYSRYCELYTRWSVLIARPTFVRRWWNTAVRRWTVQQSKSTHCQQTQF